MKTPVLLALAALLAAAQQDRISGTVTDGRSPVAGATVRLQATTLHAITNERGEFALDVAGRITWPNARVTVYAPGYYIAGPFLLQRGASGVTLVLQKHSCADDPGYQWESAFTNCRNCHSDPASGLLPFEEWAADAHGRSAANRRFLSMYNGTDLSGTKQSPATRFTTHRDYGRVPLPPDLTQPYYGPGFKLDFPDSAGNCAACHLPAAAANDPYGTDPNHATGVGREGVACDLCHKVWDVRLDPSTGLPYPDTPGVLSFEFRRPSAGHQFFAGPYDDVAPGEDTYSPLQKESRICAPCHFAQFWGTQIYNSYGEWLASPYSDPVKGQTCQDCHMPRRGTNIFARPVDGGRWRDANTIFSHLMPGAADIPLLQDTARLELRTKQDGSILRVDVSVTNEKAGHHIPTDHPARNILLVVEASDSRQAAPPARPSASGLGRGLRRAARPGVRQNSRGVVDGGFPLGRVLEPHGCARGYAHSGAGPG
jgi:hypothetical protein